MSIRLVLALLLLLTAISPSAQQPSALVRELTFENGQTTGTPAGWSAPAGVASIDTLIVHAGRGSVRIERQPGASGEFSGILKAIPLDVAGQTVVLRGFLRTKDVKGTVALWLREDGDRPNLAFDTTQSRQVTGTNDWQEHRVSVPIKPDGRQLYFGVLIAGSGTVWADDLELLIDRRDERIEVGAPDEERAADDVLIEARQFAGQHPLAQPRVRDCRSLLQLV